MSLADDWDQLPAKPPAASLADEWDAITPTEMRASRKAEATAKPSTASMGARAVQAVKETIGPGEFLLNQATSLGTSIVGGWKGLKVLASGGSLEDAAKQVHEPTLFGAEVRPYEPSTETGKTAMAAMEHPANPMNWPTLAGAAAGRKVMDWTGSPGAAAATETVIAGAPLLLLKGGKTAAADAPRAIAQERVPAIASDSTNYDVPTYLRRAQGEKVAAKPASAPTPGEPAPVQLNAPVATLSEKGAVVPAPAAAFVEIPVPDAGKALPKTEQARRVDVLRSVGIDNARDSAVRGDPVGANTDMNMARLDSPAGRVMKTQLDAERAALTTTAEQIVRDTGGTVGLDGSTLYARGNTILAPLDGLRKWFADQTKKLYVEARERGQGQPVEISGLKGVLDQKSNFTGSTETLQLRRGIRDRMAELGMLDEKGNLISSTVDQVENLRKYVGDQWSPKANGLVRTLKNTMDEDVSRAAGEDTFAKARAIHAMKKATLDDPKGIAKVMHSEGPGGINRAVAVEKVADTIASLPADQLAHIVKTLQNVPPELRPQAQAALGEIKSQFANRLLESGSKRVGQWGARDVTTYLNNNGARLPQLFTPEELARLHQLNEAGQILRVEGGYPGAAVQEHNLVRSGVMHGIRSGTAAIGAFIGGPAGAAIGDIAGQYAARKVNEGAMRRAAEKRLVPLSEFPR